MSDLKTTEGVLEWALDVDTDHDGETFLDIDTETAKTLAKAMRVLEIVEREAQPYECKSCHVPPFIGDCTCDEAAGFHYLLAEAKKGGSNE